MFVEMETKEKLIEAEITAWVESDQGRQKIKNEMKKAIERIICGDWWCVSSAISEIAQQETRRVFAESLKECSYGVAEIVALGFSKMLERMGYQVVRKEKAGV